MYVLLSVVLLASSLMTSALASPVTTMRVYVRETAKVDALVANVVDLLGLPKTSSSKFQILSQNLLTPNPSEVGTRLRHKWLSLNERTGKVTLRRRVDRDDLCGDVDECVIHLEIFAVAQQQLLNLDVIIDDVNDNPPIFATNRITLNVSENIPLGDVISLDQFLAEDADVGNNSRITYAINPNNFFELEQTEDNSVTTHLQLKLIHKLDYERKPVERLTLTASDGGIPSLRSHVQVQIRISDVNDNTPEFEHPEYTVRLLENLYPSAVIARVKAYDADSDDFGLIRYSVSRTNKPKARGLVGVDAVSGDVILKETLDREAHDRMKILIEARDSSLPNHRVGRTWLVILVDDVNDNSPTINVNSIETSMDDIVYLPENHPLKKYFAYVTATDLDSDENGRVRIQIQSVSSENERAGVSSSLEDTFVFSQAGQDGFLSLGRNLDRESESRYTIIIEACDYGTPPLCSTKTLTVILLDINDNEPVFNDQKWTFALPEDAAVGTVLTTVHANDGDAINPPALYKNELGEIATSPYGEVSYHVIDGDGTFSIHSRTGEITLSKLIDREQVEKYRITVRAKDGDSERALETKQRLIIRIQDVNDNKPTIINPSVDNSTVYATILRNDVILSVQAVDYDEGRNGFVQYKVASEDGIIKSRTQLSSLFAIDSTSGDLRLNSSNPKLNSSLGIHTVLVKAFDNGTPSLHSHCAIEVVVTDLEKLPLVTGVDVNTASSGATSIVIAAALTSSLIIMAIIAIVVIYKCKNIRKQKRTYKCRNEAVASSDWGDSSTMSLKKFSERSIISSGEASIYSKTSTVPDRRAPYCRRSDFFEDDSLHEHKMEAERDVNIIRGSSSHINPKTFHAILEKRPSSTRRKNYCDKTFPALPRTFSSHDGDSGRGDSDPDVATSDVMNDNDASKIPSSRYSNKEFRNRLLPNSKCTEQCLLYGHSDNCWMPNPQQPETGKCGFSCDEGSVGSPLYVELSPPSRLPAYSDYQEAQSLAPIPESRPIRHFSSFPANDLSSIYSNVVMNAQPQDAFYGRYPANRTPTRHTYVTSDRRPTVRMSPLSCASTPASTKSYESDDVIRLHGTTRNQNVTKHHDVINCDDDNEELSKRSTVSLFSPSSPRHQSITRSASADLLGEESSSELLSSLRNRRTSGDLPPYSREEEGFGNVSMQETQEIVDDIEKLLDS